jgi:hypothetical protein
MNNITCKTSDIMIFIALAAIAISLNNEYLAVEFSLVLILAFSPVFLAATRHVKNTSLSDERELRNRKRNSNKFIVALYFCFLLSLSSACLLANIAWSFAWDNFPIDRFAGLENILYALELDGRVFSSIMIMTDLLISWIMIRRFSGISHGGAIAKWARGQR